MNCFNGTLLGIGERVDAGGNVRLGGCQVHKGEGLQDITVQILLRLNLHARYTPKPETNNFFKRDF
jgi:hypothetical protein